VRILKSTMYTDFSSKSTRALTFENLVSSLYADAYLLCLVEPRLQRLGKVSYYAALVAAAGLFGQALIPLQENVQDGVCVCGMVCVLSCPLVVMREFFGFD
jgi:hypothetical protein